MIIDEEFLAKIINTYLTQNNLGSISIMSYLENEKYETRIITGDKLNGAE